jgi:NAD(P)-dependent dehydrogenase (short-subunit alcohol dehydrogenase family)
MSLWKGASVFMTGGGSGIGGALSLELTRRGAIVMVTDRDKASAERVAAACGGEARSMVLDVRDAGAVKAAIEGFASERGRLDYLFNNAGVGVGGETHELSLGHWEYALDVNVRGVIHGVQTAYPLMVAQRSGHIVNVASLAGLMPAPLLTPYAMTKHAVVGLSQSLRAEGAAHGVRITALCPAAIETPIIDSKNPSHLPPVQSDLDVRRHLTRLAGKPYPLAAMVKEALAGIERNRGLIVIPRRARVLWRAGRVFPALADKACRDAVAAERKAMKG